MWTLVIVWMMPVHGSTSQLESMLYCICLEHCKAFRSRMQVVFTIGSGSGKDHELVEKLGGKHSWPKKVNRSLRSAVQQLFLCCKRAGVAAETRFVNISLQEVMVGGDMKGMYFGEIGLQAFASEEIFGEGKRWAGMVGYSFPSAGTSFRCHSRDSSWRACYLGLSHGDCHSKVI